MKKVILFVLVSLLSFSTVAQDSKRESVEELLRVTNADSMIESIYAQMDQAFAGMGQQIGIKPSEQEAFDNYLKNVALTMKKEMSWEKMKEPMIDIYLTHFSEKEIQDLLKFYKTDSGRSMIDKMPAVMMDSMKLSQQMMQNFFPKLNAMIAEFINELRESNSAS